MALTDFTISDADVGRVLPISDGFLVNLSRTQAPTSYEVPDWDEGRQCWKTDTSDFSVPAFRVAPDRGADRERLCGRDHGAFRPG
jgi:hypothetical protein